MKRVFEEMPPDSWGIQSMVRDLEAGDSDSVGWRYALHQHAYGSIFLSWLAQARSKAELQARFESPEANDAALILSREDRERVRSYLKRRGARALVSEAASNDMTAHLERALEEVRAAQALVDHDAEKYLDKWLSGLVEDIEEIFEMWSSENGA